jgi:hypothetical protein
MTQKPISSTLIARVAQAAQYVISGVRPETWFGPMQPVEPMAPADVAGRKFDYPTGYNLSYTPRNAEPLTFEDLRSLADNCDILRSVIETRKDQVEALNWTIRMKPSHTSSKMPSSEQQARIACITEFMQSPDKENSFSGWLRQLLEDMFVIDAACLYKRRTRDGELYALEVIDGATIKILIDDAGRVPMSPDPAYQQVLKGVPAVDYTRDELIYMKHNPRSHKVYGYSHVEQVMMTVNILIRRALHQLEYYRDGSQPDAFIGLPKEWNQDQIIAFQKHFDAMLSGNLALRRRLRFMPGDFKYQETKAPLLKDTYDEFLARIICYVFSISPEPFVFHVNRATAESSQSRANDEGLAPLQAYVSELMNKIIRVDFNSSDLEFAWQDTREQDPKDAAQIDVAYVGAGIMTVDEVRARLGLLPMPKSKPVKKYNQNHDPENGQFSAGEDGSSSSSGKQQSWYERNKDWVKPVAVGTVAAVGAGIAVATGGAAIPEELEAAELMTEGVEGADIVEAKNSLSTPAENTNDPVPESQTGNNEEGQQKESQGNTEFTTDTKIDNQMSGRGWTQQTVADTISNPYKIGEALNRATGNPAIAYFTEDGGYVVVDSITREVVQISNRNIPDWIVDTSIKNITKVK